MKKQHKVVVIMCIWKRIENLPKIVKCLETQTYNNFKYIIWDNSSKKPDVAKIMAESKLDYEIIPSEKNVGGYGRFLAAKNYAEEFNVMIFFDDDQFPQPDFIKIMVEKYEPKTVKSRHSYKILSNNNYWERTKIKGDSKDTKINYCGTCGMVLDSNIFLEEGLFTCPEEYKFVEDLWLSYYAQHVMKWKLQCIENLIPLKVDGKDQFTGLVQTKSELLRYLVKEKKWNLNKTY